MTRLQRIAVEQVRALATAAGCAVALRQGRKHLAVLLTAPSGRWCKVVIASRPPGGDHAQACVSRQDAARALRTLGL